MPAPAEAGGRTRGPRHDPLAASTAIIACTSTPYALPFFTGPRPRRRWAVVGNFTSLRSWIARTCRPLQASPVRSAQPSTSFSAVTPAFAGAGFSDWQTTARPATHPRGHRPAGASTPFCATPSVREPALGLDPWDRSPPLSRRRSPHDPRDISMAAPVLCQPRDTELYSSRVAQGLSVAIGENVRTFRIRHYIRACPSCGRGRLLRWCS